METVVHCDITELLVIGADGWLPTARRVESPNFDARPDCSIELIVVHSISLPPGVYGGPHIEALFTNSLDASADPYFATIAALRVSAHCLIRRDGALVQFVPFTARAWHAGVSHWAGRARCNDFSIGVELEGTDQGSFDTAQYRTLAALIQCIQGAYPIRAVVGHSDIAPGRKADPGSGFDWTALQAR